jgi:hypothetical protein
VDFYFDPITHRYFINGQEVPGVTTVLKAGGYSNFDAVNPKLLEAGRIRGTFVHSLCDAIDLGVIDWKRLQEEHPQFVGYAEAYVSFIDDTGFTPSIVEASFGSEAEMFGGTLDRAGAIRGGGILADIKTGLIKPEIELQLAAYEFLLPEGFFEEIKCAPKNLIKVGVKLNKDGTWKPRPCNKPRAINEFLRIRREMKWAA